MADTREEPGVAWVCPHCGHNSGVDVCEFVPTYQRAEVVYDHDQNRWGVRFCEGYRPDPFWDGIDGDMTEVYCRQCNELLDLEGFW